MSGIAFLAIIILIQLGGFAAVHTENIFLMRIYVYLCYGSILFNFAVNGWIFFGLFNYKDANTFYNFSTANELGAEDLKNGTSKKIDYEIMILIFTYLALTLGLCVLISCLWSIKALNVFSRRLVETRYQFQQRHGHIIPPQFPMPLSPFDLLTMNLRPRSNSNTDYTYPYPPISPRGFSFMDIHRPSLSSHYQSYELSQPRRVWSSFF